MTDLIDFLFQWLQIAIDFVLHLDTHLAALSAALGPWFYVALFAVIFAETGLVVTPFLPGDSLLFAVGALTVVPGSGLAMEILFPLLLVAVFLGDNVNYHFGKWLGPRVFSLSASHESQTGAHPRTTTAAFASRVFNRDHLTRAQAFYERYGARAIVIARFAPILRTFAPFVAGIGHMKYRRFLSYSFGGSVAWISIFLYGGRWFGNLPAVQKNFHFVIFGVIGLSLLPVAIEFWKARRSSRAMAL